MTEKEYKEHIQYTHNAYCRIVIRHASIDAARMLFAKWKREISLEYLNEEKFVPLSTTDKNNAENQTERRGGAEPSPLNRLGIGCRFSAV